MSVKIVLCAMLVYVNTLLSLGVRIPVLCGGFAGNVNNSCMAWPKGALFKGFTTVCVSFPGIPLRSTACFKIQKAAKRRPKDGILACKRRSFAG